MNPAWIGVIGALGGVVLGAVVNHITDRARWEREDARLDADRRRGLLERRRALAVDLVTAADELGSRVWSFVDQRGASPKGWRSDPYVQLQADTIDALTASMHRSYNELRILGIGDELADAADRLLELVVDMINAAFADEVGDWDSDALGTAGGEFLDAASDEFRVTRRLARPGRPSPQSQLVIRPRRLPEA